MIRQLLSALVIVGAISGTVAAQDDNPVFSRFVLLNEDGQEFASFVYWGGLLSEFVADEKGPSNGKMGMRGTVILGRPFKNSRDLWEWHETVNRVKPGKPLTLVMYNTTGDPVARYHLEDAWPAKIEIGALKAGASEVLMETVTITCESIQRVVP
jgi:hypothetical protein